MVAQPWNDGRSIGEEKNVNCIDVEKVNKMSVAELEAADKLNSLPSYKFIR